MTTSWAAVLDAIDEGLQAFPPVLVDVDPLRAALGPLPSALAERARRTLHRMAQVEAALEHERADLARELAVLSALTANAPATVATSVPRYLDTKA
jgi:small-conductance mechanosensitive channel